MAFVAGALAKPQTFESQVLVLQSVSAPGQSDGALHCDVEASVTEVSVVEVSVVEVSVVEVSVVIGASTVADASTASGDTSASAMADASTASGDTSASATGSAPSGDDWPQSPGASAGRVSIAGPSSRASGVGGGATLPPHPEKERPKAAIVASPSQEDTPNHRFSTNHRFHTRLIWPMIADEVNVTFACGRSPRSVEAKLKGAVFPPSAGIAFNYHLVVK